MPPGSIHSFGKQLLSAYYAPGIKDTEGRKRKSVEKSGAPGPAWLSLNAGYAPLGRVPNLPVPYKFLGKPRGLIQVSALRHERSVCGENCVVLYITVSSGKVFTVRRLK